jgi:pyruvate,water dikinase
VITDPRSDLRIDGEILVSPMTDPGWVFLMVAAGGLVVERGSLLSHTAIIGRELGIPTVVGVANATRRIKDGDLIELDGQAGTVRIVEEGED